MREHERRIEGMIEEREVRELGRHEAAGVDQENDVLVALGLLPCQSGYDHYGEQQKRSDQEPGADRARDEHARIPAGNQHRSSQIFLHQRS